MNKFLSIAAVLLGTVVAQAATSTVLLNENFSTGSYNSGNHSLSWTDAVNGSTWTWSAVNGSINPNDTETYAANGMSTRSMPSLGANGGFEVISDPSPSNATWMVSTQVKLPATFSTLQSAEVSFDYGFRGSVIPSSFSLYDTTTGTSLFSSNLTSSRTSTWSAADFLIGSSSLARVKPGDIVALQWLSTSSSSAVSLEIGGPVSFSITSNPGAPAPPITACLAFAGVLLRQSLRSRKNTVQN